MDRLIAFGAGAVLAFGLGYLVGYEMHDNADDPAKSDVTRDGDAEDGIVDARTPKLKSLADLTNQPDDSLTNDLSEAEVKELKAMVLPHLTPTDVAGWQAARDKLVEKFLQGNQDFWAVGSNDAKGDRFDASVAAETEGTYQGQLTLVGLSDAAKSSLDFALELHGYTSKTPEGRLAFHAADGSPVWGLQFRWQSIGTDAESQTVSIVWPDFDRRTEGRFTHLALRLPAAIEAGKGVAGDLYGLTPDLNWAKAGTVELLRTK